MQFRLLNLLILVTLIAAVLGVYYANQGWKKEKEKNSKLRQMFGLSDHPNTFQLDPIASSNSIQLEAWRLRTESFREFMLEFQIIGTGGTPSFVEKSIIENVDTIISQRLEREMDREFSISDSLHLTTAGPGIQLCWIRLKGEINNDPILLFLVGDPERVDAGRLAFLKQPFDPDRLTSASLEALSRDHQVGCVLIRLMPLESD